LIISVLIICSFEVIAIPGGKCRLAPKGSFEVAFRSEKFLFNDP
jgi:hypothetical protein